MVLPKLVTLIMWLFVQMVWCYCFHWISICSLEHSQKEFLKNCITFEIKIEAFSLVVSDFWTPVFCTSTKNSLWSSWLSDRSFLNSSFLSFRSQMKFEVFRSTAGEKKMVDLMCQQVLSSLGLPKVSGMPQNWFEMDVNIVQYFKQSWKCYILTSSGKYYRISLNV